MKSALDLLAGNRNLITKINVQLGIATIFFFFDNTFAFLGNEFTSYIPYILPKTKYFSTKEAVENLILNVATLKMDQLGILMYQTR